MLSSDDQDDDTRTPVDIPGALSELGKIDFGTQSLNATLLRIAEIAKTSVAALYEVSITLMHGGAPRTAVFTGRLAVDLDERQYETGFGPCLDAATSGGLNVVDTRDPSNPYPDFSQIARKVGINQIVSVGLPSAAQMPAGLNLYSTQLEPMTADTIALVQTLASYAAVAVGNAAAHDNTQQLAEQVQELVKSRAVIEQAKGILMARHGYTEATAFAALVRTSQNGNIKLRNVAQTIVTSINRH